MDIYGKKRTRELEEELKLKSSEIETLKSDVRALERENYELKAKYEPNKGPHIVKNMIIKSYMWLFADIASALLVLPAFGLAGLSLVQLLRFLAWDDRRSIFFPNDITAFVAFLASFGLVFCIRKMVLYCDDKAFVK